MDTFNEPIMNLTPHYTDERFFHPQTVFLREGYRTSDRHSYPSVQGARYEYSDRIYGWYAHEKIEAAREFAKTIHLDARTPAHIEAYLQQVFDDPTIKLVHVMAGFNWGNGFPYQIYGFIQTEKAPLESSQ